MELKRFSLQNKGKESYNITKMYNDKVLLLENNSNSIIMNISDLDAFIKSTKDTYAVANYYGIDKLYDRDDIEYIHTNNMIKLYHVTVDYNNEPDYKMFQPRIPKSAPKMEGIFSSDFTQQPCKRVCFSDSIEGCINAIKQGVLSIRNDNIIKIYRIEIPVDEKIKFPNELREKYNVNDALFTHEHWYLGNLYLHGNLCKVTNWQEEYYYCVDDYEKNILKTRILPKYLKKQKYFDEIDRYDFFILLNYCVGHFDIINKITGINDYYIDLEKDFSFDIKSELIYFKEMSDFCYKEYIVEDTLKFQIITMK